MASGYSHGQYGGYYDPKRSQTNQQQQSYNYQSAASSASQPATAAYSTPTYSSYSGSNAYGGQKYGSSASAQQNGSQDYHGSGTAASVVNGQDAHASSRSNSTQQQDSASGAWGNFSSSTYSSSLLQQPVRTQSNTSPLYASSAPSATASSNHGQSSYTAPFQQAQSSTGTSCNQQGYSQQSGTQGYSASGSGTADNSRQTYQGLTQPSQATTEPSRYASPLHAVQAQQAHQARQQSQQQQSQQQSQHQSQHQSRLQGHGRQTSRTSNHQHSPLVSSRAPQVDHRQASASVEPTYTTVDPSQVYDFRAENERKVKADREKYRKQQEAEAAKKAEEARIAEEKRQAEEAKRKADEARANQERRRAEQAKRKADEQAAAKAEAERKKEDQRKARESTNAASTLASMASSSNVADANDLPPPADDEEAAMRAMFQKMREFNAKNPAMLAKLWEEERLTHATQSQSPQPATQSTAPPPKKPSAPKGAPSSTAPSGRTTTPAQTKPAAPPAPAPVPARASIGPEHSRPATQNHVAAANVSQANASQANASLWPPGKKGLLAEIAARWLQSVNPQKVVTTSEVMKLLDANPNYVQLCESLEALGLTFERATFARELLRGIPPIGPTVGNQSSPQVNDAAIMSTNGTVTQDSGSTTPNGDSTAATAPKRKRATKAEMEQRRSLNLVDTLNKQAKGKGKASNGGMVDYEMPSFSVPEAAPGGAYITHIPERATPVQASRASPHFALNNNHSRQTSHSAQPDGRSAPVVRQGPPMPVGSAQQTSEVKPPSPVRPPANKEEAARKRGFGDLVDLTAGDSDDDDTPPLKIMKGPAFTQTAEKFEQFKQQKQQQHRQPHLSQQFQERQMQQPGPFNQFSVRPTGGPSPGSMAGPFKSPGIPTGQQLDVQSNGSFGVNKPTPTSISAAQPTVPSSTAPPPPKRKGPTNEQLQFDRMRGKMVVEPIMRDRVARRSTYDSRTIARDILLATGRHPDMRPLNSHLNVMQKLLRDKGGILDQSGNKSDLATIKWDILDPDPPKKSKAPATAPTKSQAQSTIARSTEVDADDEEDVQSSTPAAALKLKEGSAEPSRDLQDASVSSNANANANNKPPKKRGRPPRSSAANRSTLTGANSPMDSVSRISGTPRQASGQPQATPSTAPSGTPLGYAAFRKLDENGNPVKKKGRPVGWRKSVHSREAQGLDPIKSGTSVNTSKPKKATAELQEPKYQVYKCRWIGCKAELHSLEVLKRHIVKIHGQPDAEQEYHCLWRNCDEQSTSFADIPDWLAHVDKEHLQPVAWKLGDGPRGGLSDHHDPEQSEAYLSDSRGRSVTPIIRPMSNISMDATIMPAGPGRPPVGISKDERAAHQELQKLKERKKAIGPSMEKTGVRLANEKRRMGFLDDENFEEIIDSEGE